MSPITEEHLAAAMARQAEQKKAQAEADEERRRDPVRQQRPRSTRLRCSKPR